jgi:hypothetical protein
MVVLELKLNARSTFSNKYKPSKHGIWWIYVTGLAK